MRATYNLWQSKHYLQMKSPMTCMPRQFLHNAHCFCLWLLLRIIFLHSQLSVPQCSCVMLLFLWQMMAKALQTVQKNGVKQLHLLIWGSFRQARMPPCRAVQHQLHGRSSNWPIACPYSRAVALLPSAGNVTCTRWEGVMPSHSLCAFLQESSAKFRGSCLSLHVFSKQVGGHATHHTSSAGKECCSMHRPHI